MLNISTYCLLHRCNICSTFLHTVCSTGVLFAHHFYCLLNRCTVCSTFLLFAPQVYCLLNISTVCSTGVLFAQHFYCLLHSCSVCPSCYKNHKHIWLCFCFLPCLYITRLDSVNGMLSQDYYKKRLY